MLERFTAKKIQTGLALGLASFAFNGCGITISENYPTCPTGYTKGEQPLPDPSKAQQNLQQGVAELRAHTFVDGQPIHDIRNIPKKYVGAAIAIFNRDGAQYVNPESHDTRVDDPKVEVFCQDGNTDNVYYSPEAEGAIGALASAGIVVGQ